MAPPINGGSIISGKTCTLDSVCVLYAVDLLHNHQLATLWLAVHYECECLRMLLLLEMILFVYPRRTTDGTVRQIDRQVDLYELNL